MPYIHTQTTVPLSPRVREELTGDLGQAVKILGKSEEWLMLRFDENCAMAFRGKTDVPCCFISVAMYGFPERKQLDAMTEKVTACVAARTGVPPENIYILYLPMDAWGWNGGNF